MNTETDKQLAQLIEAARNAGTDAHAFVAQHGADVVNQLVKMEMISSISGVLTCSIIAIVSAIASLLAVRWMRTHDEDWGLVLPFTVCTFVGCVMGGCSYGQDALKCYYAPKAVAAMKIAELLRK